MKYLNTSTRHEFINEFLKLKNLSEEELADNIQRIIEDWGLENTPEQPISEEYVYAKFGFSLTKTTRYRCPRCNAILSAGYNYQPKMCDQCGKALDFKGIVFPEEQHIGYVSSYDSTNNLSNGGDAP